MTATKEGHSMPKTKATAPAGSAVQFPRIYTVFCGLVDTAESAGIPPAELRAARAALGELVALSASLSDAAAGLRAADWVLSVPEDDVEAYIHAEGLARPRIVAAARTVEAVEARLTGRRVDGPAEGGEA